jgi:putative oxidoreductase
MIRESFSADGAIAMVGFARDVLLLVGRIFIAGVFLYESTVMWKNGQEAGFRYVEGVGLPGWSWWLALALNGGGGVLIVLGFLTRLVSLGFLVFCVMTALLFHNKLSVATEALQFGKDMGLAGGFLFLIVTGAGGLSLDKAIRGK